jgi:DNA-binding transcriptional LysR family regulator
MPSACGFSNEARRGVEPTVYGTAILKRRIAAFDELKQGIRDIEFLADPATGEVKIGCPVGFGKTLMLQLIEPFDRTYDLYITLLPLPERRVPDGLSIEFLFSDPLVVAAGKRHRWANRRKIEFAELVQESWILPRADSWNYIYVMDAFRARGLAMPKVALWSNIVALRNQLIATGQFVTALSISNITVNGTV